MVTPDGVTTDYIYDVLNRLDEQVAYLPDATPETLADNPKLAEYDYTVRPDGKRTQAIETFHFDSNGDSIPEAHANSITWSYDDAGRLIEEVFNHYDDLLDQTEKYTYDLTGNRTQKVVDRGSDGATTPDEVTTYTYDANDRMQSASTDTDGDQQPDKTTAYGYATPNGGDGTQQTSEQTTVDGVLTSSATYSYDLQGRLAVATVTTSDATGPIQVERTSYEYGPDGIRVSKLSETDAQADGTFETRTLSEYLIDPANHTGYAQVLQETVTNADTEELIKKVVYTLGHDVIAQTTFEPGGPTQGETVVLHADGHGSTRVLTDLAAAIVEAAGAVLQVFHYTAYGEALGFTPAAAMTTLLYSGEQFDSRIGKQYLRARYYTPSTATFNRLDPFAGNFQDPQSLHKYLYTHGDPVNGIDPSGHFSVKIAIAIGAVAANIAITTIQGIYNQQTAGVIARNIAYNLGFFALIGVAIIGTGPVAIFAGVAALGLSVMGFVELWNEWPNMDNVNRTLTVMQMLTYVIFGGAVKAEFKPRSATERLGNQPEIADATGRPIPLLSGQEGYLSRAKVDAMKADMRSGNFRYTAPEGRIALYINRVGRVLVSDGNHRTAAALEILREDGNPQPLLNLLQNAERYPVDNFFNPKPFPRADHVCACA